MAEVIVPDGDPAGKLYLVNYEEDQWMKYDDDGREFCWQSWIKWATPLKCTKVVLRLIPDELFPMHGNEMPYLLERDIEGVAHLDPFKVKIIAYIDINPDVWKTDADKMDAREAAKAFGAKMPVDEFKIAIGNVRLDVGSGTGHGYGKAFKSC